MKKITVKQNAYVEGYDGAFLRYIFRDGTESAYGLADEWYTAAAEDEDGNEYQIYWRLRDDYDPEIQDEESACDWYAPYMILSKFGDCGNIIDGVENIDDVVDLIF